MNTLVELTQQVLALPKEQRIVLAQNLWASVEDNEIPAFTEEELSEELKIRLRDEPNQDWKSHEQVMAEARREFGCGQK